jgi:hypothetical protein
MEETSTSGCASVQQNGFPEGEAFYFQFNGLIVQKSVPDSSGKRDTAPTTGKISDLGYPRPKFSSVLVPIGCLFSVAKPS